MRLDRGVEWYIVRWDNIGYHGRGFGRFRITGEGYKRFLKLGSVVLIEASLDGYLVVNYSELSRVLRYNWRAVGRIIERIQEEYSLKAGLSTNDIRVYKRNLIYSYVNRIEPNTFMDMLSESEETVNA